MKLINLFEDVIDATAKFNKRRGDHNISQIVQAEQEFATAMKQQEQSELYFFNSVKSLKDRLMKETQQFRLMLAPVYKYYPKDSNIFFVLTKTFEDPTKLSPNDHMVAINFLKERFDDLAVIVENIIEELETLEVVAGELPLPYPDKILQHSGLEMFKKSLILGMDYLEKTLNTFSKKTVNESPVEKSLYVSRKLINHKDIQDWAKGQGFKETMNPEDMHVTVCFSKKPVNWTDIVAKTNKLINKDSKRTIERFGDAIVLKFSSELLQKRFGEFMDIGCSFDHQSYQPHVTIVYNSDMDVSTIKPYEGSLVFGSELFTEVEDNWDEKIDNQKI